MAAGIIVFVVGTLVADDFFFYRVIDDIEMVAELGSFIRSGEEAEADAVAFIQTFPIEQIPFLQRDN